MAPLGDVVLREGGNQFHRFQSAINLFQGRREVPERVDELIKEPTALRGTPLAAK